MHSKMGGNVCLVRTKWLRLAEEDCLLRTTRVYAVVLCAGTPGDGFLERKNLLMGRHDREDAECGSVECHRVCVGGELSTSHGTEPFPNLELRYQYMYACSQEYMALLRYSCTCGMCGLWELQSTVSTVSYSSSTSLSACLIFWLIALTHFCASATDLARSSTHHANVCEQR